MIPFSFYKHLAATLSIQLPGSLQSLPFDATPRSRDSIWIKRDDLLHPIISGNKWRKLIGYLFLLEQRDSKGILTFGGAFSNHLHATAKVCYDLGIPLVAIVKGFPSYRGNSTMSQIIDWNAQIEWLSPSEYEQKKSDLKLWKHAYSNHCIVPEGGCGMPGLWGFEYFFDEMEEDVPDRADIVVASGTGTSVAGLYSALPENHHLDAWSVVSSDDVQSTLRLAGRNNAGQVRINEIRSGGFAAWNQDIVHWIIRWWDKTGILLDPLYTGPAFYHALQLETSGPLVLYHSGGLQAWRGYLNRYGDRVSFSDRERILDGIPPHSELL